MTDSDLIQGGGVGLEGPTPWPQHWPGDTLNLLFNDLGYNTSTNGATAFADGETHPLLDGNRAD